MMSKPANGPHIIGLTGSIGMGKSTTAQMFVKAGCALWDADAAVHNMYAKGGAAVAPLVAMFPQLSGQTDISRDSLRAIISADKAALQQIEAVVHPLVAEDRHNFLSKHTEGIIVLDIPLLFETGGESKVDAVACVDIPADVQQARVLARGTMSKADFKNIRAKQMPNAEKVAKSDYVIVTDSLEHANAQVQDIVADIRRRMNA